MIDAIGVFISCETVEMKLIRFWRIDLLVFGDVVQDNHIADETFSSFFRRPAYSRMFSIWK